VLYTAEFVPSGLRFWYLLNPLAVIIDSFAKILFYGVAPDLGWLAFAFLQTVVIFILCFGVFQRIKRIIPEWL
jgi:ABC-type polysaccharide/polyol phosphate export permease